ncbi:MAG: sensor histidine kinase [bacterium]
MATSLRKRDHRQPGRGNRLAVQLFGAGAVLILVAAVVLAAIGTNQAHEAILSMARNHVMGVVRERQARLEFFLFHHVRSIEAITAPTNVRSLLAHPPVAKNDRTELQTALDRGEWREDVFGIREVALLDISGTLIASSSDWTSHIQLFHTPETAGVDSNPVYGPVHLSEWKEPVLDIAQPLQQDNGKPSGFLLLRLATRPVLEKILTDTAGLGTSGEVYLVGPDTVMLTPSRMRNHPDPLTHKMPIPTVLAALKGKQGTEVYRGFLGNEVVGAYAYLPGPRWALIGEMNVSEALTPLRMIVINSLFATVGVMIVLLLAAVAMARTWSRPMVELAEASRRVAEGDVTVRVRERRSGDEIGLLLRSFNQMVDALQHSREVVRESQQRVVQSEKMAAIGQLVASIVHEMRNPLSSVKMNLRLLQRRLDNEPANIEHLELAVSQATRLETMLSELLTYSKPTDFVHEECNSHDLARRAVGALSERAKKAGIQIEISVQPENLPSFQTDAEQLLRALINLLLNAIESCEPGGKVSLRFSTDDSSHLLIQVSDTGRGIHASVIPRIFDPFFTTKEEGTGLGLANVRKFVDLQGGTVSVHSEEGSGSTFTVTLPMERGYGETPDH